MLTNEKLEEALDATVNAAIWYHAFLRVLLALQLHILCILSFLSILAHVVASVVLTPMDDHLTSHLIGCVLRVPTTQVKESINIRRAQQNCKY